MKPIQELFEEEWMEAIDRPGQPFPDQLRVDCDDRRPYTTEHLNNAWAWFRRGHFAMVQQVMDQPTIPYRRDIEDEDEE